MIQILCNMKHSWFSWYSDGNKNLLGKMFFAEVAIYNL